jgi:hypothetical protein
VDAEFAKVTDVGGVAKHAATLLLVLGQYPVPKVFQTTEKAFAGRRGSPRSA